MTPRHPAHRSDPCAFCGRHREGDDLVHVSRLWPNRKRGWVCREHVEDDRGRPLGDLRRRIVPCREEVRQNIERIIAREVLFTDEAGPVAHGLSVRATAPD